MDEKKIMDDGFAEYPEMFAGDNIPEYEDDYPPDFGLVDEYFKFRKLVRPNEEQAMLFLITEIAELAEVIALR